MQKMNRAICQILMRLLPATRCYRLKARLMRCAGYGVSDSARLVSSARLCGNTGVVIGDNTFVGHDVLITGGNCKILIGSCVDIAPRVLIIAGTHEIDMIGDHSAGSGYSQDIKIEDGVWIGAGAVILGGVTIGRKAIIAAGSVVTSNIPAYCMAAGVPCRAKKMWNEATQVWSRAEAA